MFLSVLALASHMFTFQQTPSKIGLGYGLRYVLKQGTAQRKGHLLLLVRNFFFFVGLLSPDGGRQSQGRSFQL